MAIGLLCFISNTKAQTYKQNIVGKVLNKTTLQPIDDVTVTLLLNGIQTNFASTNDKGDFVFNDVEVGRYDLSFSHIAFKSFTKPGIFVSVSRVTSVEVVMEQALQILESVEIKPQKSRGLPLNEMAAISAISIDVEDTRKLAGGLDDPIRAATNLPGVNSNGSFSDNFISIRGNSPRALKYSIEGVELPNPTHFARIGSAGGTFTIFSLQLLDNSDFFIGAFPAEYGNAIGGVLDTRFRKGNNQKNEFSIQAGTLGLDFAAEGPLSANSKASYLFNARYAVVGLARLIGYPTQPTYSDVSFLFNFPLSGNSNLKIFSISGTSDRLRTAVEDPSEWEEDIDRYELALNSQLYSLGLAYTRLLPNEILVKFTTLGAFTNQTDNKKYTLDDLSLINRQINEYKAFPFSAALSAKHQYNAALVNKTGVSFNYTTHNYMGQRYRFLAGINDTIVNSSGNSITAKGYTQWKYSLNKQLSFVPGVHLLYHNINNAWSIEPRFSVAYRINEKNKLAAAYGLHSQIEEYAIYKYQFSDLSGNNYFPNESLGLAKAHHFILGYETVISLNHRLSIEGYFQNLYHVPVEKGGTFSTINLSELDELRTLTNDGSGRNIGIDLGFERYSDKGLYYMLNASWINSKYKVEQQDWRSTEFDFGYNIKFLLGREYTIGEKKNRRNVFSWNSTVSFIGGTPYTPIDLEQSALIQETVFDETLAFTAREEGLIVWDFTTIYRTNKKSRSAYWALQIKNLLSSANAVYREYDTVTGEEVIVPSSSFFPVLSYGLEF